MFSRRIDTRGIRVDLHGINTTANEFRHTGKGNRIVVGKLHVHFRVSGSDVDLRVVDHTQIYRNG